MSEYKVISFKKQKLGKWRRDDGELKSHVTEETMHREVQKLVKDGWKIQQHGITHLRALTLWK